MKNSSNSMNLIIEKNAYFKGTINANGNIKIGGIFEGKIYSDNNVYISSTAEIIGDIEAKNVYISGKVNGNIFANGKVHFTSTSCFEGNITARRFVVDKGAIISGVWKNLKTSLAS